MLSMWLQSALAWQGTHSLFRQVEALGSVQSALVAHATQVSRGAAFAGPPVSAVLQIGLPGVFAQCVSFVHSTQPVPGEQAFRPAITWQS